MTFFSGSIFAIFKKPDDDEPVAPGDALQSGRYSEESAYTYNEINSKKITKPKCGFQLSLGGNIS